MQALYRAAFGSWEEAQEQAFLQQELGEAPYYLLCRGQSRIGFFSVEEQPDACFLRELQLRREEQGRGLGTCFLLALSRYAAAAGKELRLEVLKGNEAAARLYRRLGFCPAGQNQTHLKMKKKVSKRAMQYILFDLDGTLTDSKEGIFKSAQYALAKLGITPPPLEEMNWVVGPPIRQSFAERYGLSEEAAFRGLRFYQERFGSVGYLENRLYEGVAHMLEQLHAAGCRMAVATSKPTFYATRILQHFGLDSYFEMISGSDLDGTNGKKELVVERALEALQADPKQTAMVGDRSYDMKGALKFGLYAVGAGYGYGDPGELEEAGAQAIAQTVEELTRILLGGRGV